MILVTGGTGLIGSYLLFELLKTNKKIRCLIRDNKKIKSVEKIFSYYSNQSKEKINQVEWVKGDILDVFSLEKAFEGITKVYHCAAMISFDKSKNAEVLRTNIEGTANIVNMCLENKIYKLCHVSSIAALGKSNFNEVNEDCKWIPAKKHSVYSISKFKSEMEVWRGIEEGLNAVIVNPSVVLGAGFWKSGSGELFTKAAKGSLFYTEGGTGFVDVADVVDSMIKLMENPINSERFILNGDNVLYKDFFTFVANETGRKYPKIAANNKILKIALLFDSLASFLKIKKKELTKEIIESATQKTIYSNKKVKENIKKEFIPVKETIKNISKIYKEELIKK